MSFKHYSVLLDETIEKLNIKADGIYVDATLGGAGHSQKIYDSLNDRGRLICFDQDDIAIDNAKEVFKGCTNVYIIKNNFVNLRKELLKLGIEKIDGIIFDLGVSSMQIDESGRGFSYINDGPLDMRMDKNQNIDAKYVVNNYSYEELVEIFEKYGEEKLSRLYASKIVEERQSVPFTMTSQLTNLILNVIPKKDFYKAKSHPAIRIFQAIRIEVNKELLVFEKVLPDAIEMLNVGGRICVITFHSLEDKICKHYFKEYSKLDDTIAKLPIIPSEFLPQAKIITNKPILPRRKELEENSRSNSAKLRVLEKSRDE